MLQVKMMIIWIVILLISVSTGFAQDANELLKSIDEKLFPESFEAYRKLINEEPDGNKKEYIFYTVKKGNDKMAMLYLSPASEKGRASLRLGDNMWLYIPNVGKPIRITSLQSVIGGVFNNADIMRLDFHFEYDATILEKTETEYILDLKAKSNTVAYDKLKMWITKKSLLVTKIECYSASGMLIKTLEFKEIKDFGNGIVRPSIIETHSPLYKDYRSIMIYSKIKVRKLPDEVFTLNYLPKLGDLR